MKSLKPVPYFFILILLASHIAFANSPTLLGITAYSLNYNAGTIVRYVGGDSVVSGVCILPQDPFSFFSPTGSLIQTVNGRVYGMTKGNGSHDDGSVFEYIYNSDTFITKASFDHNTTGGYPSGSLVQATNGKLYGLALLNNGATLFSYDTGSYSITVEHTMPANSFPYGTLIQSSNGKLYGLTHQDGTNSGGTIFEFDITTSTYNVKVNLPDSAFPYGSLLEVGIDTFYGLSYSDGLYRGGTLFRYILGNGSYDTLYNFHNGANPSGSLIKATNGKIYGTVSDNGNLNAGGNLFSYDIPSHIYVDIYDFDSLRNGRRPLGSLLQASDGNIYGMTSAGGANRVGVIFQYDINTSMYTKQLDLSSLTGGSPQYGNLIEYHPQILSSIINAVESSVHIYSKPNAICIERLEATPASIIVTDLLGQQVINTATNDASITLPIEMSNAIYIVQVREGDKETVRKVFVR